MDYFYTAVHNRGRLSNITRNGAQVAAYTHDESEQRIVKAVDGTTLHYHYDLDGRLIAETNGTTGETLREYVWLGLMPIAVIDVTDEAPDTACAEEITALEAQITDRTTRLDNNAEAIAGLFDAISDKEARISANEAAVSNLEALILDKDTRIATHAARIVELGDLITDKQSRIAANAAAVDVLTASIVDKESRVATNIARIAELTSLIAADEAELGTLDPALDAARIAFLSGRLASRHEAITALITRNSEMEALNAEHATRITELTTRNTELAALITSHETRIPELTAANDTLSERRDAHVVRAGELTTRNAELAVLVTAHETRIDELSDRNLILAEQLAQFEAELIEAEANCETVAMDGLYYLHADHLGRPQFATDTSGTVVWDMGGDVTPFGDSVNLAGAFAQQLMFPGQYADVETGDASDSTNVTLSHNWHRTYDPTLGRYLQSDPIGLAGGLNRYAYAASSPLVNTDPTGQIIPLVPVVLFGSGFLAGYGFFDGAMTISESLIMNHMRFGRRVECYDYSTIAQGLFGSVIPGRAFFKDAHNISDLVKLNKLQSKGDLVREQLFDLRSTHLIKSITRNKFIALASQGISEALSFEMLNFNFRCECDSSGPTSNSLNSGLRGPISMSNGQKLGLRGSYPSP